MFQGCESVSKYMKMLNNWLGIVENFENLKIVDTKIARDICSANFDEIIVGPSDLLESKNIYERSLLFPFLSHKDLPKYPLAELLGKPFRTFVTWLWLESWEPISLRIKMFTITRNRMPSHLNNELVARSFYLNTFK